MDIIKNIIKLFLLLVTCTLFTACSDDNDSSTVEAKKDHVWKTQTDAIDKAKEVEALVIDAAENTRKTIEAQESR